MIDFRYHLVSIVAVFLALAIGLVVGAASLQGPVITALRSAATSEKKTNDQLQAQKQQLAAQLAAQGAAGEAFAQAGSAYLLSNLLRGERVVLVTAPGADGGTVNGITAALARSGAEVAGTVQLGMQFFDGSRPTESSLTTLAQQLAPASSGLPAPVSAGQIPGQDAAAQVLAAALVHPAGQAGWTPAQVQEVLTGFGQQYLQVKNGTGGTTLTGSADLAVVVIPATPAKPANPSSTFNLALAAVAQQLRQAGQGALLAGSTAGSGTGSAIDAINSGAAGVNLTTVDNADTVTGQIEVVQALRMLLDPHSSPAAYGVGPGKAPSPAPSTPPTPSPTLSASPGASPSPKRSVRS